MSSSNNVETTGFRISHKTTIRREWDADGDMHLIVKYHDTDVVDMRGDGVFKLNTDGWRTSTTKARMNNWLPPSIGVHQRNFDWYVAVYDYENSVYAECDYEDGIEIEYDDECSLWLVSWPKRAREQMRSQLKKEVGHDR